MLPSDAQRRYSQHARRSLVWARLLAQEYHHTVVETDHILLGIWKAEGSLGYQVLQELEIERAQAEDIVRGLHPQRDTPLRMPPYSQFLQSVLHYAADEAYWLGHHYIGTEHILLGLVRSGTGQLSMLLLELKVSGHQLRQRLRRLLSEGAYETTLASARRSARLSELSKRVLNAAAHTAREYEHQHAGIEHLLLVLAREKRSIAAQLLYEVGFEAERLAHDLTSMQQDRVMAVTALDEVLQRAVEQAEALGTHYTGSDHILLALTLDEEAIAIIQQYGGAIEQLHERTQAIFNR